MTGQPEDRDRGGRTPLHNAAGGFLSSIAEVRELLASGADPNARDKDDFTPLHMAAQNITGDSLEAVKELLKFGADPNALNCYGDPPLMTAVIRGHSAAIAKLLLDAGADPYIVDAGGFSPARVVEGGGDDPREQQLREVFAPYLR